VHFNQPTNPSKIAHDKTSAMRNVHILCSNCPSPDNGFVDDGLIQLILSSTVCSRSLCMSRFWSCIMLLML